MVGNYIAQFYSKILNVLKWSYAYSNIWKRLEPKFLLYRIKRKINRLFQWIGCSDNDPLSCRFRNAGLIIALVVVVVAVVTAAVVVIVVVAVVVVERSDAITDAAERMIVDKSKYDSCCFEATENK